MTDFKTLKEDISKRCKDKSACRSQFVRIIASETSEEILQALKDNISWCMKKNLFDIEWLEKNFSIETLHKLNIYTSGSHDISVKENATIVALGSSSATVKTRDSSSATVETFDISSATVETFDSSSATVETWGSSSATVETWDISSATVKTRDISSATVKTRDSSSLTYELSEGLCPTIKHLNERKLFVKTTDFEIVQVK